MPEYKSITEWSRTTAADGNLFQKEFSNLYTILSGFGSNLINKTVSDSITFTSEDITSNQIIFIKPSADKVTIKLPSAINSVGKIQFILLPTEGDTQLTATLNPSDNEKIFYPVGMGDTFGYYDLLNANEGVTLLYGNGQWVVNGLIGLPSSYQLGKVDFMSIPGEKLPNGCLLANGSEVSRTTYRRLFDVIGVTYGAGDGTTTFKLPNQIGYFMRGATSDVPLGTVQEDAMQKMTGKAGAFQWSNVDGTSSGVLKAYSSGKGSTGGYSSSENLGYVEFDNSLQVKTADETRPKNISYTAVIYF